MGSNIKDGIWTFSLTPHVSKLQSPMFLKSIVIWTVCYDRRKDKSWFVCTIDMRYKKSWVKLYPEQSACELETKTYDELPEMLPKVWKDQMMAFLAGVKATKIFKAQKQ